MSQLKNYRHAIKAELVAQEIFTAEQIIVDRQADEWSVIEQAFAMANTGFPHTRGDDPLRCIV